MSRMVVQRCLLSGGRGSEVLTCGFWSRAHSSELVGPASHHYHTTMADKYKQAFAPWIRPSVSQSVSLGDLLVVADVIDASVQ